MIIWKMHLKFAKKFVLILPSKPTRMVEHAAVNRSVDSSSLPGAAKKEKYPNRVLLFFYAL